MTNIPKEYATMSESELYRELADALTGGQFGPGDREESERFGLNYFQKSLPKIREHVCSSPTISSFVKKDDVFAVAGAIAELISGYFGLPRAVATLAVLAARMGLKNLCPTIES